MSHDELLFVLFMSRLPLYLYAIGKMWRFRNSMVIIPSKWLGISFVIATLGATVSMPYLGLNKSFPAIGVILGYAFAMSVFITAHVSKEVKRCKIEDIIEETKSNGRPKRFRK